MRNLCVFSTTMRSIFCPHSFVAVEAKILFSINFYAVINPCSWWGCMQTHITQISCILLLNIHLFLSHYCCRCFLIITFYVSLLLNEKKLYIKSHIQHCRLLLLMSLIIRSQFHSCIDDAVLSMLIFCSI